MGRIANFDDLDPLVNEPSVTVDIVPPGRPLPADAALVLIPGSKSTIADLQDFRAQGWDIDMQAHRRRGGAVWGICGGYQMLGKTIADPDGIEGPPQTVPGLGLLDVDTVMTPHKRLVLTDAVHRPSGTSVTGYEIHIGETKGPACDNAPFQVQGTAHGAASVDGQVVGAYLHGMFAADGFRRAFLQTLGGGASDVSYSVTVEQTLDALCSPYLSALRPKEAAGLGRSGLAHVVNRQRPLDFAAHQFSHVVGYLFPQRPTQFGPYQVNNQIAQGVLLQTCKFIRRRLVRGGGLR